MKTIKNNRIIKNVLILIFTLNIFCIMGYSQNQFEEDMGFKGGDLEYQFKQLSAWHYMGINTPRIINYFVLFV